MGLRFKTCKGHQAIKEMRNLAKGASAGMFANKRLEIGLNGGGIDTLRAYVGW